MDSNERKPGQRYGILADRETRQPCRIKAVLRESEQSQSRVRCIFLVVGHGHAVELANFRLEQN